MMCLSNLGSVVTFTTSAHELIKEKHSKELTRIKILSISAVEKTFLQSNLHLGVTKSSHRINIVRRLMKKQMRKNHFDTHAYSTLRITINDLLFKLAKELSKARVSEAVGLTF